MSESKTIEVKALVIGAGPAGYPCGIRLGQLGIKAVVVEKDQPGGVCLNVGCIPSKALINAAKNFEKMRTGEDMGLYADNPRVDMKRMQAWKSDIVKKLTGGVKSLLKANGSEYVTGEATIGKADGARREVLVKAANGETTRYLAEHVVVATGSRPIEIPGFKFDGKRVLDSTGALALDAVPAKLVVIGGGYIGLELGMCLAKLGSKVTVVEATPSLLPGTDPELLKPVEKKLKKLGVEVLLETKAVGMTEKGCKVEGKNGPRELEADKVLVTVGRRPNLTGFGLEEAGVKVDKGRIVTDQQMRTNVAGIYAIGDVAPGPMLAHKGTKEGEVVAEVIAGKKAAMDPRVIPAVIFVDPEIATCGLSEQEAKEQKLEVKIGRFPFAASGRAMSTNETDGMVKVICTAAEPHTVLGIHIVGAGACDLISEAALAIEMGAVADDLSLTIHPHPTLGEAMMESAKHALGEAVHILNR